MPLVTKPKNPVVNGVVSVVVGVLVLALILFLLKAGANWAGPMPKENDDQTQPITSPSSKPSTPGGGK